MAPGYTECVNIGLDCMQSKSGCVIVSKIIVTFGALQELVESLEKKIEQELSDNVTNNELVNKLTTENEQLKVSII